MKQSDRKYFGTDGVRGTSNTAPMDAATVLRLGMAAGAYFRKGEHRHRVVIGKDTRLSGYMLEPALTSGFVSMGMDVILVGPMPTPAISMLTRSLRADLGVMLSASHNPFSDNGIKFFDAKGLKLSDAVERKIEALMDSDLTEKLVQPDALGRARRLDDAPGRYIEFIKHTFPKNMRLDGLKIVLDCANGAAYKLAPTILWELGAEIIPLSVDPDGFNINAKCGSTHPKPMQQHVVKHKADIGIALDGDADRVIICDEKGELLDGDQIMAAIATYWKKEKILEGGGMIATVMSNLGMEHYLKSKSIKLERSQVGDRYVIEAMKKHRYNFGGEQSGHIIFGDYTTTGDGILAALQVLAFMIKQQKPASELRVFTPYPQILKNVKYNPKKPDPLEAKQVQQAIKQAEIQLKKQGRLLIRKSGTEPLIRIMAEGENEKLIESITENLADTISNAA